MIKIQDIKLLDIEITSYCNLHCPQCDRFDAMGNLNKHMQIQHLDLDQISKNLDLDLLTGLQEVVLEGDHGDPMMHPDVLSFIQYFKNIKKLHVVTNGSMRSEKWWRELANHKNLTVTFSIDGLKDTLDTYRINADFDKIIKNAQAFISAGGRAVWKYIVFHHNEHQIEQAKLLSRDLGFKDFNTHISNRNFFQNNEFPIYIEGIYQNKNLKMSEKTSEKKLTKVIMLETINSSNYEPITCSWLNAGSMYVDHLGNVIPCCMTSGLMWRNDISGQLWQRIVKNKDSINLYHHPLSKILKSEFYQHRLHDSLRDIKSVHHACVGNCLK